MSIRYLIDTDWVIHYFNGNAAIVKQLTAWQSAGLGISIISLAELYEGIYYSTDPVGDERALHDFLQGLQVLGIDDITCQIFGKERGRLRAIGKMIGDFDLLIGATAIQHQAILLSNNRRHYEMIEKLQLLSV